MPSIIEELNIAEAALSTLCEEVQRKTSSMELRKEYQTLLMQATGALNKMRSIAELQDFFSSDSLRKITEDLKAVGR